MISIENSHNTYPNQPTRAFLEALEDVLGKNGLNALLRIAGLPGWIETYPADNFERDVDLSEFSSLNAALEEIYGDRGGHGLARRASESAFDLSWKQYGPLGDLSTAEIDAFPEQERIKEGARLFAETLSSASDLECEVISQDDILLFRVHNCPICWGRESSIPTCAGFIGLLEACIKWISPGMDVEIIEIECAAVGGEVCIFTFDAQPKIEA